MRIFFLSAILLTSFYYFWPQSKEVSEIDAIKMKISAPARKERRPAKFKPTPVVVSLRPVVAEPEVLEDQESYGDTDISGTSDEELAHVEEPSTGEHERGWEDELSQILLYLEPEFGEEMFNAYVSEKNAFQASLDELIRAHQKNQDLEILIGELEMQHEERIKEIFGRHYEDIKDQESRFLESEAP